MELKLADTDFLFGDSPSIADFSAYHNLWFKNVTSGSERLEAHESINGWFQRMSEFGHGDRKELAKTNAFEIAKDQQPRDIPKSMINAEHIGKSVEIMPNDYAKDAVAGVLVGGNEGRWILARETTEFGTVHVHFPTRGFEMTIA